MKESSDELHESLNEVRAQLEKIVARLENEPARFAGLPIVAQAFIARLSMSIFRQLFFGSHYKVVAELAARWETWLATHGVKIV